VLAAEERRGTTYITRCQGQVPVSPRIVSNEGDVAEVVLVQTAAGILSGDHLRIEVRLGPRARLRLSTVGATIAYPALVPASHSLSVEIAAAGRFAWLPGPLVLANGSNLAGEVRLEVESGGAAYVRELIVTGRHCERPGRFEGILRCVVGGAPLLHDRTHIAPSAVDSSLTLGGARAYLSAALLGLETNGPGHAGESKLAGPGRLYRAVERDAPSLFERLGEIERIYLASLWAPDECRRSI
jgi:urease accessory protein